MRGPQPTPTAILKARGSRLVAGRAGEVEFPAGTPQCPAWLAEEAQAEWKRQVKQLKTAGVLCLVDRAALAAYCDAWAEFVTCCTAFEERMKDGLPLAFQRAVNEGIVNAKARAVERLLRLAREFGFTPAARARIKGPGEKEGKADNGKSRFFAG
jgi:P27 family predicted phage terminase small subunit